MKKIIEITVDLLLGLILAAGTLLLSYAGLREMITEGSGWYDHEDYMYTILLILSLWIIAYVGVKLIIKTFQLLRVQRELILNEEAVDKLFDTLTDDQIIEFIEELEGHKHFKKRYTIKKRRGGNHE